ncbi:MAG: RecX family transcriptional regulator [Microlunatus sp.]
MAGADDPVDQARAWLARQTGQPMPPPARRAPSAGPDDLGPRETESGDAGVRLSASEANPAPEAAPTRRRRVVDVAEPSRPSGPVRRVRSHPTDPDGRRPDAGNPDRRGADAGNPDRRGADAGDPDAGDPDAGDPDAEADPESVARTIALRKLAAQARTRHELAQAMRKKNVPDEAAATVLDRLEKVGLVDDRAFAQDWVTSRQQRRHLSKTALRRELRTKGVDREHLDHALATVDHEDELAAARALATKKAATMRSLEPVVRERRLAGALARRGFGTSIISTVLGELRQGYA